MRNAPILDETASEYGIFRDRLAALGLSVRQFSARVSVSYSTALGWGTVRTNGTGRRELQAFPTWADLLLREWEAHGVPDRSNPGQGRNNRAIMPLCGREA